MTAQASEALIYKAEKHSLCSNPLGPFLESSLSSVDFCSTSTALWRGYIGTWTIEGGRLYLTKLKGFIQHEQKVKEVGLSDQKCHDSNVSREI